MAITKHSHKITGLMLYLFDKKLCVFYKELSYSTYPSSIAGIISINSK